MNIKITQLSNFLELLQNNNMVNIKNYKKKDGSSRDIKCTLNFKIIPKDKYPDTTTKTKIENLSMKGLVTVFDVDKMEWRSLILKKINLCIIGKSLYDINID